MITKNDIEKFIAAKTYTTNPEWPNLESSGWKWKKHADGTVSVVGDVDANTVILASYKGE